MATSFFPSNQLPVEVKGQDAATVTEAAVKHDDVHQDQQPAQIKHFMNVDSVNVTEIRKFSDHFVNHTIMEAVAKYQEDQMNATNNFQQENKSGQGEGNHEGNDKESKQDVELGEGTGLKDNNQAINVEEFDRNAKLGTTSLGDETCLREVTVIIQDGGIKHENYTNDELKPKSEQVDMSKSENSLDQNWPFLTAILPEYTYELLPKVKVLSGFTPTCTNMIYAVCPLGDGGAWISYYYSRMITLVDSVGKVHQLLSHSTAITDISVAPRTQDIWTSAQGQYPWISPQGQNLLTVPEEQRRPLTPVEEKEFWTTTKKNRNSWTPHNTAHEQHLWMCSGEDFSVWECCTCTSSEKPVLMFKTDSSPRSLCATMDGHIIVGMHQVLTKFTKAGKPLFSTKDFQVGKHSLVKSPHKITECPVTQNIAVLDRVWSEDEQQFKSYVLVMDMEFQEVFRYKGRGVTQVPKQSFKRGLYRFDPVDVKYDSIGNLVIGDRQDGSLHLFLINGEGQLTNVLHTDQLPTQAIGIDRKNVLWAAFNDYTNKHIKLLQYSN